MIARFFSKFKRNKKNNFLLITPPLLEPESFYPAMPTLVGQLISNGYKAKNLDLNIKFFRKVLTTDYIKKTISLLKEKNIEYDSSLVEFLLNNIDNAVEEYRAFRTEKKEYKEAYEIIIKAMQFISKPYPNFKLETLNSFEFSFNIYNYNYQNIKDMTFDKENNIFISYFEEVVKEIKNQKPDLIGITIPFPGTIIPALTLARILKEKTKAYIVLGGNFIKSENVINNPELLELYCDAVLTGDGEESIVELAKSIEKNTSKETVSGLVYKNKNNQIICNPQKPVIQMNNVANTSFEGLDLNEYLRNHPNICIMSSKGCYWGKCNFCSLGPKYEKYTIKTPQKMVEDIKELIQKYDLKSFFQFSDDALSPAYLNKLADELINQNVNIYFSIFARFEKEFTKELLEKLYKAGLRSVYWGLESGCQSVLNKMNKGVDLNNVYPILKTAHEIGISNYAGIIVNFPTETIEEYNKTLEFLKTVEKYVTISPGEFSLMKNSNIEKNTEEYGVEIIGTHEFSYTHEWKCTKMDPDEKKYKWEHFCDCVKNANFSIDSNKRI